MFRFIDTSSLLLVLCSLLLAGCEEKPPSENVAEVEDRITVQEIRAINKDFWIKLRFAEYKFRKQLPFPEFGINPPKILGDNMAYLSTQDLLATNTLYEGIESLKFGDFKKGADLASVYVAGRSESGVTSAGFYSVRVQGNGNSFEMQWRSAMTGEVAYVSPATVTKTPISGASVSRRCRPTIGIGPNGFQIDFECTFAAFEVSVVTLVPNETLDQLFFLKLDPTEELVQIQEGLRKDLGFVKADLEAKTMLELRDDFVFGGRADDLVLNAAVKGLESIEPAQLDMGALMGVVASGSEDKTRLDQLVVKGDSAYWSSIVDGSVLETNSIRRGNSVKGTFQGSVLGASLTHKGQGVSYDWVFGEQHLSVETATPVSVGGKGP